MLWCPLCQDYIHSIQDEDTRMTICVVCGKVINDAGYEADEPTLTKAARGHRHSDGKIIKSFGTGDSKSYFRTSMRARYEIEQIVGKLHVEGGETITSVAHRLYMLALDHKFTRGRRRTHVAAACLYIACQISERSYLLVDFSGCLQISVYVLGAVFLQLCHVLLFSDDPSFQDLIDRTHFIQRFTSRLREQRNNQKSASNISLLVVACMEREWIQTGRKPSGILGASLYIATFLHGIQYTKADTVAVIHICDATLTKSIEFQDTDSDALTTKDGDAYV